MLSFEKKIKPRMMFLKYKSVLLVIDYGFHRGNPLRADQTHNLKDILNLKSRQLLFCFRGLVSVENTLASVSTHEILLRSDDSGSLILSVVTVYRNFFRMHTCEATDLMRPTQLWKSTAAVCSSATKSLNIGQCSHCLLNS